MMHWFPLFYFLGWIGHWFLGLNKKKGGSLLFFLLQLLLLVYAAQTLYFGWTVLNWYSDWTGQPIYRLAIPEAFRTIVWKHLLQGIVPLGFCWARFRRSFVFQILLALVLVWVVPFGYVDLDHLPEQFSLALSWMSLGYGLSWFFRLLPFETQTN